MTYTKIHVIIDYYLFYVYMKGFGSPKSKFDDERYYQDTSSAYENLALEFRVAFIQNTRNIIDNYYTKHKSDQEINATIQEMEIGLSIYWSL